MEIFYYPTMTGECIYQTDVEQRFDSIPSNIGYFGERSYALNTGNIVIILRNRRFCSAIQITRKALPINDLYILSFNIKQKGDRSIVLESCDFTSATAEREQQQQAGDVQLVIDIHLSRAYVLTLLNDFMPYTNTRWANALKNNELVQQKVFPAVSDLTLVESIFELLQQLSKDAQSNHMLLQNKVSTLLLSFFEQILKANTLNEDTAADADCQKIKEVQELIENDLSQKKYSIQELSARCNMCPTKFKQLFKRFIGCSLSTFYNDLRMKQAYARLQVYNRRSISELAYHLGYKSLSHFTTAFRNHYGYAPSAVQKSAIMSKSG